MSNLQQNGIRGVMLSKFKSYLSNRKQYVSVKNSSSSMSNITLGVPPVSVLGPVLFLLHTTGSTTQPLEELVEWRTAESEVSGSNPRDRF